MRCASGSWDGRVRCVNPAADDTFCLTCLLSIFGDGPACDCEGCEADAELEVVAL